MYIREHHFETESTSNSFSSDSERSVASFHIDDPIDASEVPQHSHFILTVDNIHVDKNVTPRDMTLHHQTKSLHYFHTFAALNCNDVTVLSEEAPTSQVLHT